MQKITPFLWFNDNAEEAMNFYVSIFKNAEIVNVHRLPKVEPEQQGNMLTGTFQIEGEQFMVLNGGPHYKMTPGISLFVNCETQEEVDDLWEKLSEGGEIMQCGWLTDRFGVTWQIIPTALGRLMGDPDPVKSQRVMQAMLQMKKIDIAGLERAYAGE